jgi:uncharacterized membrane protein
MFRYGHPAHHPVLGILFLVLLGALVVLGVLAVIRLWKTRPLPPGSVSADASHGPAVDPALTEVRMRYARGEITSDEYLQRVAGLGYPLPPGTSPGGPYPTSPAPPPPA